MAKRGRPLTPDEQALWQETTRDAKPLPQSLPLQGGGQVGVPSPLPHTPMARDPHPTFSAKNSFAVFFTPRALAGGGLNPLTPGTYAGVDRANAERLHRGQYPIDRRLDLHGMDRDAAFAALAQAIPDAAMQGKRCLLIITGKGHAGGGVLRQSLPAWLNAPGLREHVLAFDAAQPRHGGSGAFYLLLKRKRP